jgi:hypothetical protein
MPKEVTHRIEGNAAAEEPTSAQSQTTGSRSQEGTPQDGLGTEEGDSASQQGSEGQGQQTYEYQNPMLRGRTPEEVERIFGMYEQTTREQGARLSATERRMAEMETRSAKAVPEPKVEAQEFFADPMGHVKRALDDTVAPLRQEIQDARAYFRGQDTRVALRQKYDDWDVVEPYVNHLLSQANYPDPNDAGLLETLYYTAKGVMVSQGINVQPTSPQTPSQAAPVRTEVPAVPPQHRASTPPPPPPRPAQSSGKVRELTESEKRIAREHGLTPEEYIKWQEMDISDVATADFDRPKGENNG